MGISLAAPKTMWTPEGEVPLAEKDVIPITRNDIILLSKLHEFAQQHDIAVVCRKCDRSIGGHNNDTVQYLSVACQCREFRYAHK